MIFLKGFTKQPTNERKKKLYFNYINSLHAFYRSVIAPAAPHPKHPPFTQNGQIRPNMYMCGVRMIDTMCTMYMWIYME